MTSIKESVIKSLQRASLTFKTFPVTLASAAGFTIVTLIRIWMDWPQQEDYNFLFNCLHLGFAAGAIFGFAAITAAQRRFGNVRAFSIANGFGGLVGVLVFLILFLFGGEDPDAIRGVVLNVSNLWAARVSVLITVSVLGFIYFAGQPEAESDFPRSLFMTQKAFLIAAIYGGVMMGGTSGVAGAIQALLYRNMSSKVYMVLGALIGLVAFAIFVGYFPDFQKGKVDPHRETAQKQPRFIEVLFEYIMVPILLVLTLVLLSWTAKTVVTGEWPSFSRMSGIVISYSVGGIWLYMMISRMESGIAKAYRRIYPIALLVILAFGAWAFVLRLNETGMRSQEYAFSLVLIASSISAVLLIWQQNRAHVKIAGLVCILALVSVLPLLGYHALPVRIQLNRLENLLVQEGMLVNDQLVPATVEPDEDVRIAITDAVDFLAYEEEAKLPAWFDEDLANREAFQTSMGFEQTWKWQDDLYGDRDPETMGMFLMMPNATIDISEYDWAVYLRKNDEGRFDTRSGTVEGEKGTYRIAWVMGDRGIAPQLTIFLDDQMILQQDMKDFMDETAETVRARSGPFEARTFQEMSTVIESPEVKVLLVFQHMNIFIDPQEDIIEYNLDIDAVYLKEN